MSKRNVWAPLAFAVVTLFCVASARAQATKSGPTVNQAPHDDKQASDSHAFLGVAVEAVPPSLAAHLHENLPNGGLLVGEVADDSPAAKAGIKQYDVITTCDDQKLTSPEQLINLIRAKKPGDKVAIGIIRQGKTENLTANLSELRASERAAIGQQRHERRMRRSESREEARDEARNQARERAWDRLQGMAGAHRGGKANWERFESLNIEKTGKDQFKAAIAYRNEKGEVERKEFTGTREQIEKDIHNVKDLPRDERAHLQAALDMQNSMLLPGVRFIPGEGLVIDLGDLMPEQQDVPTHGQQF